MRLHLSIDVEPEHLIDKHRASQVAADATCEAHRADGRRIQSLPMATGQDVRRIRLVEAATAQHDIQRKHAGAARESQPANIDS
ncbi:MAG: hypothetical protein DYG93_12210 [Leptolyngbya sp. PLA2]|nr:hypothetical protein [Leptolyngbya sp. PL-A2]GIK19402.1 MAG: hypothetical protein BroJett004_15660 [Planctomycetota bacterium]